ncbi:hypothetical protein HKX48_008508 [Thoreauomyces humboldtii]|nr:hypothetical protein HKX48_008508 [Thoreauomyces humboldtii]
MSISTELTALFAITHPIVLAPMAGVAHARLVAAVANAGCLALLGVGYATDPNWITTQWAQVSQLRKQQGMTGAAGIGFITWWLDKYPELLSAALACRPAAIWFSFGDFGKHLERVREEAPDVKVMVQVQTVEEAIRAAEFYGVDVVVAQGSEAGGHGRTLNASTFCLLPEIAERIDVPVLAAGGVSDGRQLAATLMLGSSGVVIGTRFCATHESAMPEGGKQLLVSTVDGGLSTTRTRVFDHLRGTPWPDHYGFRVLCNNVTQELDVEDRQAMKAWQPMYDRALKEGDFDVAHVGAGQGVGLVRGVWPAALVVQRIVEEAFDCLEIGGAVAASARAAVGKSRL